tara:strand:- start:1986 stop:2096 length:111 start_codon:yes stop_codon:yes gene_type:complete
MLGEVRKSYYTDPNESLRRIQVIHVTVPVEDTVEEA